MAMARPACHGDSERFIALRWVVESWRTQHSTSAKKYLCARMCAFGCTNAGCALTGSWVSCNFYCFKLHSA